MFKEVPRILHPVFRQGNILHNCSTVSQLKSCTELTWTPVSACMALIQGEPWGSALIQSIELIQNSPL